MNGLRLTIRLMIQPVAASTKTALRNTPSGRNAQSSSAKDATASSTMMPAESILMRERRDVSFQASLTSV
ncbi:hypothetical protein D3C86_2203780 [compost metagenome]